MGGNLYSHPPLPVDWGVVPLRTVRSDLAPSQQSARATVRAAAGLPSAPSKDYIYLSCGIALLRFSGVYKAPACLPYGYVVRMSKHLQTLPPQGLCRFFESLKQRCRFKCRHFSSNRRCFRSILSCLTICSAVLFAYVST